MTTRTILKRVLGGVVALVIVLLLVGQLLGQPILLGYVATGSMEPTMDAGDGFVSVPSAVTGSPEEGDVVVFEARELHDGELTTHRIVDETEEGYVTSGDANPFTDQDSDEPHVTDDQIVATAWAPGGDPVTIPHLGTAIMGIQGGVESAFGTVASTVGLSEPTDFDSVGAVLVGLGVALLGFGILLERLGPGHREATRTRSRPNVIALWTVLGVVLLVFVTGATAAMVIPSGTVEYGLASTTSPSDDPQELEPGETGELTQTVNNAGYLPIVAIHESDRESVGTDPDRQTVGPRSSGEATVSLTAPQETGEYTRAVEEHRYIALLPPSVIEWLHDGHPLLAIAAVNGVIVGVAVTLVLAVFGRNDIRIRSTGVHVSLTTRVRRKIREWR
ncbi:signal peptidase, endoplasmic reticulum-type [Natronorubrum sediminis]|uniref:Signal peptidase, endoplasmic reticulum-type n=1 Tax=Natronorubrum sediminis TaxID=640943 RepID=A0A1H6FTS6_9EURY|nr:S26 family signal peptidase [Natronorubrum sediminis]SEH13205.1 signal peptidase, endoplasmic reticulum-type [Natronorubrum sediminis]